MVSRKTGGNGAKLQKDEGGKFASFQVLVESESDDDDDASFHRFKIHQTSLVRVHLAGKTNSVSETRG